MTQNKKKKKKITGVIHNDEFEFWNLIVKWRLSGVTDTSESDSAVGTIRYRPFVVEPSTMGE